MSILRLSIRLVVVVFKTRPLYSLLLMHRYISSMRPNCQAGIDRIVTPNSTVTEIEVCVVVVLFEQYLNNILYPFISSLLLLCVVLF